MIQFRLLLKMSDMKGTYLYLSFELQELLFIQWIENILSRETSR